MKSVKLRAYNPPSEKKPKEANKKQATEKVEVTDKPHRITPLPEPPKQSGWAIFFRWFSFIATCTAIYFFFKWVPFAPLPTITGLQAVVFGFTLAFLWVEIMKWGSVKPFNCLKCMSGWLTLLVAIVFHVEVWYLYLPVGLFVGALFDRIKGRYL